MASTLATAASTSTNATVLQIPSVRAGGRPAGARFWLTVVAAFLIAAVARDRAVRKQPARHALRLQVRRRQRAGRQAPPVDRARGKSANRDGARRKLFPPHLRAKKVAVKT